MGFSLSFMRLMGGVDADADRAGLASWLERHGLTLADEPYRTRRVVMSDGSDLILDGVHSELELSPLDAEGIVAGHLSSATLGDEESRMIYDLCVAARFLIVNLQGEPETVVPGGTHRPEDLSPEDLDGTVWVESAAELAEALSGGFERFREYREQVVRGDGSRQS